MDSKSPIVVAVHDAKAHFSELLDRAVNGEEITITRQGNPVARLIPARAIGTVQDRLEAVRQMRELAQRNRLNGLTLKDLIAEGRR